jgi:hypothetical protein
MPDVTDQATIDIQASLRATKSLATLVLDRQSSWESNTERLNFVTRAKSIIKYTRDDLDPYLDTAPGSGNKHEDQDSSQFTSRVMSTLEDASDAFCGNLFVPTGWYGYEALDPRIQQDDEIQAWLQRVEGYMGNVISGANFYPQMPNVAMDALSIGDGIMFVGEDEREDKPFVNYWESLNTWFIRDMWGNIIAVHHRWHFSALEAYGRWGTKCSKTVVESAEGNRPADGVSFIQAIYRRNDPIIKGRKFSMDRPFIEVWIQEDSEKNPKNYSSEGKDGGEMNGILEQKGYHSMPVMDWPYWWKSSETYGRSPMHLVTIKRLHAMWKSVMLGAQRMVAPPLLASKALENLLDLGPDGVTWVQNAGEMDVHSIYQGSIQPERMLDMIARTEEEVRDMLKLNIFLAMTLKTKDMRVDEVMQVIGEQSAILAPRIGLLSSLCLDKFHDRLWSIEENRGRLMQTDPPGIVMNYLRQTRREAQENGRKYRGLQIRIMYKGPLQLAQDSFFAQRRLAAGLGPINAYLYPLDPEGVADKIDVGAGVEEVIDRTGSLQTILRSDEEVLARQAARVQAQNALMQAQAVKQGAGAIKDVASAAQTITQTQRDEGNGK